jgi:hypothetical protein
MTRSVGAGVDGMDTTGLFTAEDRSRLANVRR